MKLVKQKEVDLATHALHTLRLALESKTDVLTLKKTLAFGEDVVDNIRSGAIYSSNVKCVVENFDRLAAEAGRKIIERAADENYRGPRRGQMSISEKTSFISRHGQSDFLKLPS